jgi:soluble lytic murein transglycosylase
MALAAYNGGETNVLTAGWPQARAHGVRRSGSTTIPFPETRAYVERVLQTRADYRHTYAAQLGYR